MLERRCVVVVQARSVYSAIPTACDFDFQTLFITLSFCSSIHDAALDSWLFYKETVSKIVI